MQFTKVVAIKVVRPSKPIMNIANLIHKHSHSTCTKFALFGPCNQRLETHDYHCRKLHTQSLFNRHYVYTSNEHKHRSMSTKAKPKARRPSTHYETLGLTPKATPSQIKSAYYRLSKKYHPDVNQEEDAHHNFTKLTNAYEVLGNKHNKRHYDRGTYNHFSGSATRTTTTDMGHEDYTSNRGNFAGKRPPPTGKTQHFDFDEFYRQHYGEFVVKQTSSNKREVDRVMQEEKMRERTLRKYRNAYIIIVMLTTIGYLLKKKL